MKKFLFFVCCFSVAAFSGRSQTARYFVRFTDKNGTPYQLNKPQNFLSAKSIQRRTKQGIVIDSTDLPINPAYLDSIRLLPGVTILNTSKWMNQVLIRTGDFNSLAAIKNFPFVLQTDSVATQRILDHGQVKNDKLNDPIFPVQEKIKTDKVHQLNSTLQTQSDYFNYGNSYAQIHIHEGEYMHNLGFHGEGLTIAILDAGFFGYLTNPAFDSLRLNHQVLGTWDYVNQKESVNEENPHGGYCLSILASNEPGTIIGTAPKASYWLFKTEDDNSETLVEEQNWTAAAEFADSAGVDLISTSLGYVNFDVPADNHTYADRNGHTALITRAANFAFAKGMIVTASAGNSGASTDAGKYIACPADGDSVMAVGAVDVNGIIASFSSWGPNSSGGVKPNVVSVGQGTVLATADGNAAMSNGTSYANPNLAGLVTCLWQAFPQFSAHTIFDAVQRSSSQFSNPDGRMGYGIPNFHTAYDFLAQIKMQGAFSTLSDDHWLSAYPIPFTNSFDVIFKAQHTGSASLQLVSVSGATVETKIIPVVAGSFYSTSFTTSPLLARGIYFIRYNEGATNKTIRTVRL